MTIGTLGLELTRGPTLEILLPARYRRSAKLPDLRSWTSK
jgi:hypothetical protein